jgi:alpha-L-rhamnosidase
VNKDLHPLPDELQPGFKHIIMKPHPVGDLEWVSAAHRSPHGLIKSEWRREGGQFDWRIEVPANTTATVHVPAKGASSVTERGKPAAKATGVEFERVEGGYVVFRVGSGSYHLTAQ